MDFRANRMVSQESGRDGGEWTMVAQEARNLVPIPVARKGRFVIVGNKTFVADRNIVHSCVHKETEMPFVPALSCNRGRDQIGLGYR